MTDHEPAQPCRDTHNRARRTLTAGRRHRRRHRPAASTIDGHHRRAAPSNRRCPLDRQVRPETQEPYVDCLAERILGANRPMDPAIACANRSSSPPADLRSPTFTPHGRSSATSTVAADSRHTRNRASSSSSWAGRVPAHVYSPAILELEPHHSGVGGIVLRGQRGRVAPRSDVVRPLGHLGPMAAEPFGVPLQRGAAPAVAAVEATRHQLAAYPGTGMAGIPFPVILAIPGTRLSPARQSVLIISLLYSTGR